MQRKHKTYHYDTKTRRFRDSSGHFVARSVGMRSSVARAELLATLRPKRKPRTAPTPRPPRRPSTVRRSFTYDPLANRFRDAQGKIISRERGLKSKIARAQFEQALAKKPKAPPRKKPTPKPKPAPRKKAAPIYPMISEQAKAPGQFTVEGIRRMPLDQLAEMIITQINDGYLRFRFWYKVKKDDRFNYAPNGIGSTQPLYKSVISGKDNSYELARNFVAGRRGWIFGRVYMYWMSKR